MSPDDCSSGLSLMTDDIRNGMTFAMSVWKPGDGNLNWLEHGRCSGSCSEQDLKFKNLTFTTAAHSDSPDNDDTTDDNDDSTDNDTDVPVPVPVPVIDPSSIAAGFEAIRNNPHYDATHFSRTLWQVD